MFASAFLAFAIVDSVFATGIDSTSPNGKFQFRSYNQILQYFYNLQREHPAIVKIFDALDQDKWRDAIAPNVADAHLPQCGGNRCKWLVVHITNHAAYNALTPEMYISGCLHGDEQVGPNAATEYASFLADEYAKNNTQIRHLLNTRSLWMTPMTNAWGYYSNSRLEKGPNDAEAKAIDSNRDFPYNDFYKDGNKSCMKSIAARVIAELYKRQMILVSLTLHSGIESVSYLWGSLPHATEQTDAKEIQEVHEWLRSKGAPQNQFHLHCHKDCTKQKNFCCKSLDAPDLSAFKAIGDSIWLAYGTTANDACGRQKGSGFKARGYERESYEGCWYFPKPLPITDDVYAVNGGLEDFSYAYSWERRIDTEKESPAYTNPIPSKCSSDRYGGYTMIAENWKQSVKQLNYLIELTDKKDEKQNYGHRSQVFRPSPNDGHIARSIRAFIRVLELLHPEVVLDLNSNSIYGIGCRKFEAKLVKVDDPNLCSSQSSQMVDSSQIGRLQTVHDFKVNKCRGLQLWRSKEEDDQFPDSGIKLPDSLEVGKCYAIVASFDQEWANQAGSAPRPRVSPQSHLVRARTNDKYEVANAAVNGGSRIEAKKYHFRPFMINTSKAKQVKNTGEDCGRTGGKHFSCGTGLCKVTDTGDSCPHRAEPGTCSCVALKHSGDDCGKAGGHPFQCAIGPCEVTDTGDLCPNNAAQGTCTCFASKNLGDDCGRAGGKPFRCAIGLCEVRVTGEYCPDNAAQGTCTCVELIEKDDCSGRPSWNLYVPDGPEELIVDDAKTCEMTCRGENECAVWKWHSHSHPRQEYRKKCLLGKTKTTAWAEHHVTSGGPCQGTSRRRSLRGM